MPSAVAAIAETLRSTRSRVRAAQAVVEDAENTIASINRAAARGSARLAVAPRTVRLREPVVPIAPAPPEMPQPLAPAREALRVAIARVGTAQANLEAFERPVRALEEVIHAADRAEAELAEALVERERAIGAWLAAGQQGPRPALAEDEQALAARAREAREDAEAAKRALPGSIALRSQAAAALAQASERHREMIAEAAIQAARELVDDQLVPAVEGVLRIEARLAGLRLILTTDSTLPNGGSCAARVGDLIRAGKGRPAVARDDAGGRRFLDQLGHDPAARL
jgi:hypothetical protein